MNLGNRIKMILKEDYLKQRGLAKRLGVTGNYISALLDGRNTNIPQVLAALIGEKYGYSSSWILTGAEPKLKVSRKDKTLLNTRKKTILKIEQS